MESEMANCPWEMTPVRVRCLLGNARNMHRKIGLKNWSLVQSLFGVGFTKAHEICEWAEIDPDGVRTEHPSMPSAISAA